MGILPCRMGRAHGIEDWLLGAIDAIRQIPGGENVKVGLVGPVVGVRPMPYKEGKEPSEVVEVLTAGAWGKEIVKIFCPPGTFKEGETFRGHVDVSVYQNRLSVRYMDKISDGPKS